MREIWDKKAGDFEDELNRASKATGEYFELPEGDKGKTLKELLKTDKARLRAFFRIIGGIERATEKKGRKKDLRKEFAEEIKVLRILDSIDTFLGDYKSGKHSTLEPRQVESLAKIGAFLRSGKRRGYLELPTGLGKTVIFSELIEAIKDVPGIRVLVVGSANINAIQNAQKIERFGGEEVGQYFAGKKDLNSRVVVCNYHGLRNGIQNKHFKGGDFDLVLLDEVHDGLGEVTQNSIERTFKKETMIGFSATATYELSDSRTAKDFLPVEIDRMGVVEAVKENLLSAFKVEIVKIPNIIKGVPMQGGDYLPNELEQQINTEARNNLVVQSYTSFYRKEGERAISFCVGRQHTRNLAATYTKAGIRTGILTGELDIAERELVLQKLKNGEIEMLCGSKLSWQALDETEVSLGLNVTPSLSEKDVIQRGGRMLRRSQVKNDKKATIVEFLDEWREKKNRPVFYSEILETAEVEPDKWKKDDEQKPYEPTIDVSEEEVSAEQIEVYGDDERTEEIELGQILPEGTEVEAQRKNLLSNMSQEGPTAESSEAPIIPEDSTDIPKKEKKPREKKYIVRYVSPKEIMAMSNQNRKIRNEGYYEYAPKGWMSANLIAVELGISTREVEDALPGVQAAISERKFEINNKIYLSALGIKRVFFAPELVDLIYTHFVKVTRTEKLQKGELRDTRNPEEVERESIKKEEALEEKRDLHLDWRDYDLRPSFTLEGESLDDEEEGVNIHDTSELHGETESIDGPTGDLVPYKYARNRYEDRKYDVLNSKSWLPKKGTKELLRITERYGLEPNEDILSDVKDPLEYLQENEMWEILMEIIDELNERERMVITRLFLENDQNQNTQTLGQELGVTGSTISMYARRAIRKIRTAFERRMGSAPIIARIIERMKKSKK